MEMLYGGCNMEFIFDGRDKAHRTGNERIAMKNIRHAIDWIVGGYYNAIQDGEEDCLPVSYQALADEIYDSSMNNLYAVGMEAFGRAPREMRFAGTEFAKAYIEFKLSKDDDVVAIGEVAGWYK